MWPAIYHFWSLYISVILLFNPFLVFTFFSRDLEQAFQTIQTDKLSSGNDYYFQWGPRRNNRESQTAAIWEAAVFGYWWVGLRQHLILSIEPHSKVIYLHPPFDQVGSSDQDHPHVRLGVGHWLCKWTLLTPIWHELPKVEKFWIFALMQTTLK